ncbi:MAG: BACON domain-containing protein, partial [Anaerolineales bacterium]
RDEAWGTYDYYPVTIDLGAFDDVDQIRIAWQYVGLGGESFSLDKIQVFNSSEVSWLSVDPLDGTIPGESSLKVSLTFNTNGMTAGDYETLLFLRNPTQSPMPIPTALAVRYLDFLPLILY